MEIVLYKNSVGRYYRCYELGDLTDAGAFPGGISQATGGNNPLSRGGSRDTLPVVPSLPDRVNILDQNVAYKTDPQQPAELVVYREAYFPDDPELVSLSIQMSGNSVHMNNWGEGQYTRADVYLGIATISGVEHIGFFAYNTYNGNWGFLSQENESDACGQFLEYAEVEASPGEKGFRPTGAYTSKDKPGIGGRGSDPGPTPRYKGDPLTQPGAPDESAASAVGSGFLTCYKIDQSNLDKVGKNLYGQTLLDLLKNMAVNPMDFIVSLMVFPCAPAAVGGSTNIKLGGWLCAASGGAILNALGTEALANPLTKQFKVIDFGTVQIPENWGSFLDYQTSIELYLPFIGSVTLDVSECMGGDINVQYTIDFFTGMCVANVLCRKPAFVLPSGQVIANVESQHSYQGNCAIQIPVSRVDYGSMIGSLINACTQGFRDPVGMLASIADGAVKPNVSSKGNIVANSGFCSVLYPYVRLTRPITAEPDSYQEVMGYPSYVNTTLGECEDLCVCDDIDLKGITGATDNEINRIRQLCKEGVYV